MPASLLVTAALFVVAGVLHFVIPRTYVAIMPSWLPSWLPSPLTLVYVSGVFEALGGVGLLLPATRLAAAIGLIVLLAAVFPANVEMLRQAQERDASALFIAACWIRLPLQPLLIWWVWRVARAGHDLSR
ncbi:MAG: DoxX family protein [Gemmatimonadaceae bacterium]|nr:DoxX family protein [Gemmatimonadaceae bacterium]